MFYVANSNGLNYKGHINKVNEDFLNIRKDVHYSQGRLLNPQSYFYLNRDGRVHLLLVLDRSCNLQSTSRFRGLSHTWAIVSSEETI